MTTIEKIENIIDEEIEYMKKRMRIENISKLNTDKELDYTKEKITNGVLVILNRDREQTNGTIIDVVADCISKIEENYEWCEVTDEIAVVQIRPLFEKMSCIPQKYRYHIDLYQHDYNNEKIIYKTLRKIPGYQTSKMFKFGELGQFKRMCAHFDIRYIPTKILDAIKTKVIHE